jgi:excisionase family DNA binding protein
MIQITAADLNKTIDNAVNKTRRALEEDIAKGKGEFLLTAKDVLERLSISRKTLYNWEKKGYLRAIEIGGKHRYKLSDVNAILESANK